MKPAQFAYHAPARLDELLALLADGGGEARVIAGGQSLVPMMNFRLATPETLVDLRRVDALRELRREPGGALVVGAGVTQGRLLADPRLAADFPLLAAGIEQIGHPQIRSRGTVCGSLAHSDPTAELPALALALDARMTIASARGRRELVADDFLVSYYETALEPGELLERVIVRAAAGRRRLGRSASWPAAAATSRSPAPPPSSCRGGTPDSCCSASATARGGSRAVEELLVGADAPAAASDAAARATRLLEAGVPELVAAAITPSDDVHASADYRRELAGRLAVAVITDALERAT